MALARGPLGLALLVLVGLAATAMGANETELCGNASYKVVPFMKTPVSATDLDQLMEPVWWIMRGNSFGAYDSSQIRPQLMNYLKQYSIQPIAGVGALFALVILSMLIFLLWRFTRCLCVVCCQQEAYADAGKVLFSKRLRVYKVMMGIFIIIAIAMAAWGMRSLNQSFPAYINKEIDTIQEFPARMVTQVRLLADETANIAQPLASFEGIINEINITGMRADLAHINDFFQNSPKPSLLKEILDTLNAALKVTLVNNLDQLQAEISGNSSSALEQMKAHIATLQAFSTDNMNTTLNAYDAAITDVINQVPASLPMFSTLQQQQVAMGDPANGTASWLQAIGIAKAAAQAIDAMRNPSTNPFTIIKARLDAVNATATDIKTVKITNLTNTITVFNSMWYNNASLAFEDLLEKAIAVNKTVLVLPADVQSTVATLNESLASVNALYSGNNSLNHMPENITDWSDNLDMPDTTNLTAQLTDAESKVNGAGPDLAHLIETLDNLTSVLNSAQPSVNATRAAITTYTSDWDALKTTLQANNAPISAAAIVFATADLGDFISTTAGEIATTMGDSSADLATQASSITGVKQDIADFDMSSFDSALVEADNAYAGFGGDPTSLTNPVIELLDQISEMTSSSLATAKTMVANVSSQIDQVADQIQAMGIDKLDGIQERFLPTNKSDPAHQDSFVTRIYGYAYYGLMGAYAVILFLILVLFLATYKNFPAGLCMISFLLNLLLIFFAFLPVFYTIFMLLMRDTCANVESLAIKAVEIKAGTGSLPSMVASYYLGGGKGPDGTAMSVTELISGLNPDYDIDLLKGRVNQTIAEMMTSISDQGFTLQYMAQQVLDDVVDQVQVLMAGVDGIVALLDYDSVSAVYYQLKGWLCCDLADQLFVQWVACLILLAMAWVAMICALAVLRNLDGLSDSCCACRPYNPRDYQAAPTERKRLSSIEGGDETVAVVNIGGGSPGKGAKSYEMIDSTPLPPPLHVMQSAPSAPVLQSPRMYPSIAPPTATGGAGYAPPTDLQAQRMSLMGPAMYPSAGLMTGGYGYGQQQQQQQPPQQQGWGRQSPSPSGAMFPRI